ncbi:MAG: N-glycosylase/DNA lyase [Candidatus Diapherotrites archaeon]
MRSLSSLVGVVNKNKKSRAAGLVKLRMREFRAFRKAGNKELFGELCFCLLTANYSAEGGIKVQCAVGDGFISLPEFALAKKLRACGYRFPNVRAKYIVEARKHKNKLRELLGSFGSEKEAREWLVKNVKGIGWKEASHFLRNVGYEDVAIVDFHIIDLLKKHNLLDKEIRKGALTEKKYLEIERILSELAKRAKTSLAELDLYLWFEETGKVLK